MATALVTMAALHCELAAPRVTLVTPNRRLAVFHKREFERAQLTAGLAAWTTPDILPYAVFVERTWRTLTLRAGTGAHPQLLGAVQSQLLWEQVIHRSEVADAFALMNISQTAIQAASAWALAHAWHLLPAMRKIALHDDAAMFMAWANRYQALCREKQCIDAAVVVDALSEKLNAGGDIVDVLPARILTVGFDIVSPQQHHLWRVCGEAGVDVSDIVIERVGPQSHHARAAFATEIDEFRACAAWARERLLQNPQQQIAIVVPQLQARRPALARALSDALMPEARASTIGSDAGRNSGNNLNASSLFNFSLGQPFGDYALVREALALLAFSQLRTMPFLEVSALVRSPFIAAADREQAARARLDERLREISTPELSLKALQKCLSNDMRIQSQAAACSQLTVLLERVAGLAEAAQNINARPGARAKPGSLTHASPQDWCRHFAAILIAWGFPGERPLGSIDFQVMAKFRDALASLAILSTVQARMRADEALSQLRRIVADTQFQPESESHGDAPIQVLGILESAGQSFDAMWVTGLSDDAWPLAARPNPFIPAMLQRSAGIPESSAAASLELDKRITTGWKACANELVFSHVWPEGHDIANDGDRGVSALIRDIPLCATATLLREAMLNSYATALQSLREVEPIPDTEFPALPAPTAIRGGASVMRDQAACPFRAFARHRLGARELEVPQPGLDAAERGKLLHRVLYFVWGKIVDHATLLLLDAEGATKIVADAASRAIAEAHSKGAVSLAGHFADIEQARLVRVIVEWLAYERERSSFTVVEREALRKVQLGGLELELRLDRLDRLADGTYALLDYKTGIARLSSWLGERPDEPQLPVYYQTADEEISALAFARVKLGERGKTYGFEGVSAVEGLLPNVQPIETRRSKPGYASWDVLTQEWEVSLAALATGFVRGDATVDPKHGGLTCGQCDLQSVCRIAEIASYAAHESAAADPEADDA